MKSKYLLIEDTSMFGLFAPQGTTSFEYNRSFSYDLGLGTYYLILQHPGSNVVFDVKGCRSIQDLSGVACSNICKTESIL